MNQIPNTEPLMLSWDDRFILFRGGKPIEPDVRTIEQMKDVLMDKSIRKPKELYYMYRGQRLAIDYTLFFQNSVRYDITIIPAAMLGTEFVKTAGHFHPKADGLTYPEIYEVLEGEAHYLLFKKTGESILIRARVGNVVMVPPEYGHITINPSNQTLVMANLVSTQFSSDYGHVKKKGGAPFFFTSNGMVKNENYPNGVLEEREAKHIPGIGRNIYKGFRDDPAKFTFLNNPEETPVV
jgi:glucose-6-phosphate isomerase